MVCTCADRARAHRTGQVAQCECVDRRWKVLPAPAYALPQIPAGLTACCPERRRPLECSNARPSRRLRLCQSAAEMRCCQRFGTYRRHSEPTAKRTCSSAPNAPKSFVMSRSCIARISQQRAARIRNTRSSICVVYPRGLECLKIREGGALERVTFLFKCGGSRVFQLHFLPFARIVWVK